MALVLSEKDYKLVTIFQKVAGIFTLAAGTISLVDHQRVVVGLLLVVVGIAIALAPMPMGILRPEAVDREIKEGELQMRDV